MAKIGLPLLAAMGLGAMAAWRGRKRSAAETNQRPNPPFGTPVAGLTLLLTVALLAAALFIHAGLLPFTDQDSWTTWGYNSRALYAEGSVLRFLATQLDSGLNQLHHPSYSPALPLLNAWSYLAIGGVGERMVKLLIPLWYLSLLGLIWSAVRSWNGPWIAGALTL